MLSEIFMLLFLLSAALLIPYSATYSPTVHINVFMYFVFLLHSPLSNIVVLVAHLFLFLQNTWSSREGEKVRRKWRCSNFTVLALVVWSTIMYIVDAHTRLQSPFTYGCTAVQDASLLNSTIIRSESAGKTREMRKRTLTHTRAHGRPQGSWGNFFITPSEAQSPLWNKDIYDCLPFGKSEPGWVLISCDCALRLSSSSAAAHYQKTHSHLFDLLYIFPTARPQLLHPSFQQDVFLHHIKITSGPSSLNSLWHLLMGWSVLSLYGFGPGLLKQLNPPLFVFEVLWESPCCPGSG